MRNKLLFLLAIFAIFGIIIAVRFVFMQNSAKEGKLKILTSPEVNVVIDNNPVGKTPYEESLEEGEYLIKLIPDENEASGSASWSGKIKVFNNTLTFVNRELGSSDVSSSGVIFSVTKMEKKPDRKGTGQIEVETEPTGSIVYLDNEEQGISPLLLSEVPEGDHELSVASPGFFRRSQKIKVETGFRIIAQYKLAIDPTHRKVEKKDTTASDSAQIDDTAKESIVTIKDTETGWLRVREEPTLNASEAAKVNPGDTFKLLDEDNGWIKINYEKDKTGWISSNYAEVKEVDEKVTDEP